MLFCLYSFSLFRYLLNLSSWVISSDLSLICHSNCGAFLSSSEHILMFYFFLSIFSCWDCFLNWVSNLISNTCFCCRDCFLNWVSNLISIPCFCCRDCFLNWVSNLISNPCFCCRDCFLNWVSNLISYPCFCCRSITTVHIHCIFIYSNTNAGWLFSFRYESIY